MTRSEVKPSIAAVKELMAQEAARDRAQCRPGGARRQDRR